MQARDVLGTSVLLVDDQTADLVAMERYLASLALRLVTAHSGEEALDCFQHEEFALILMDVGLPGLNGIETARRMGQFPLMRPLPLIFITGSANDESRARGYAAGGVDWLSKPVNPDVLRAKVRIFVDMYREREALKQHEQALREREHEILEARRQRAESERERLVVELREAVRLRDEFLSVASHELRTPLTPLALRLQLLRQELRKPDAHLPRMLGHVEAATAQVRRVAALMDSLLDVTRITSGRLTLRRERDVNLAAVVRDVASSFEAQAARANCPLELDIPARVLGQWDIIRLEQIVTNLLSNALKFGAGGTVSLRLEEQEGWARLTVRDEGIGMDEALRSRLFGRFERGVSERHYGGLGLGLFITRQVTEALGGSIQAESTLGAGSTFTVRLPCTPREGDAASGGVEHGA